MFANGLTTARTSLVGRISVVRTFRSRNCATRSGSPKFLGSMKDEKRNSAAVDQEPFHVEKRSAWRAGGAGRLRRVRSHRAVRLVAVRGELSKVLPFGCGHDAGWLPLFAVSSHQEEVACGSISRKSATAAQIDRMVELAIKMRMRDVCFASRASCSDLCRAATTDPA